MSYEIRFTVPGQPVPQERPRVGRRGAFKPPRSREYARHVAWHAVAAFAKLPEDAQKAMLSPTARWSLGLHVVCEDHRRRDLSNILKALEDACNGILWRDDSQIDWFTCGRGEPEKTEPRLEVRAWIV